MSAAFLLWICSSDVGLDAASIGTGIAVATTTSGVTSTAAANSSLAAANGSASVTTATAVCPPGYICYVWDGPIGPDARVTTDPLPSIVTTLLFIGGCIGGAVLVSYLANLAYNRYTALPKMTPPDGDDDEVVSYDEMVVKRTLLTRLGVMSWKADPAKPQDRFAKRAALTWLRRVARIRQAPDAESDAPETDPAAAADTVTAAG